MRKWTAIIALTISLSLVVMGDMLAGTEQSTTNSNALTRLPMQEQIINTCRRFDSALTFAKVGTGFNELLWAASRTGNVQRTINIVPDLVAGHPVRGVNVFVETLPDNAISGAQGESAHMETYMIEFVAMFAPETSCRLVKTLVKQVIEKEDALPVEIKEDDGNLVFSLKKEVRTIAGRKKVKWSLSITDFQSYTESVEKELSDRK